MHTIEIQSSDAALIQALADYARSTKDGKGLAPDIYINGVGDRGTASPLAMSEARLNRINEIIFSVGAPLGSNEYFNIRGLCTGENTPQPVEALGTDTTPTESVQGLAIAPEGCHYITPIDGNGRRLSRMDQREYDEWANESVTTIISDLKIVPKKDFGPHGVYDSKTRTNLAEGWQVVYTKGKYKGCLAMPGAVWSYTREGATNLIHAFIAAGGDPNSDASLDADTGFAQRFHALVRLTRKDR